MSVKTVIEGTYLNSNFFLCKKKLDRFRIGKFYKVCSIQGSDETGLIEVFNFMKIKYGEEYISYDKNNKPIAVYINSEEELEEYFTPLNKIQFKRYHQLNCILD